MERLLKALFEIYNGSGNEKGSVPLMAMHSCLKRLLVQIQDNLDKVKDVTGEDEIDGEITKVNEAVIIVECVVPGSPKPYAPRPHEKVTGVNKKNNKKKNRGRKIINEKNTKVSKENINADEVNIEEEKVSEENRFKTMKILAILYAADENATILFQETSTGVKKEVIVDCSRDLNIESKIKLSFTY
jgi:hypothetical protein